MKQNWFALLTLCSFTLVLNSASSSAQPNNSYGDNLPLLYKEVTSGYVPEEMAFSLKCEIYPTYYKLVLIKNTKTQITAKKLTLDDTILKQIKQASGGTMTYQMAPADIGNSIYGANLTENKVLQIVDLGSTLDSQSISTNSAPEASELKTFIDTTCVE